GAHINPAVTIMQAVRGTFEWSLVPGYVLAQIAGGMFGGVLVYFQFIFLVENEKIIKNTLTSEYRISNIMEEISNILECTEMTAQNAYGDEISLCYETIEELINNDLYKYISTTKQKKIFNAKTPSKALEKILNELGRKQLKIQIEELLIDVDNTEFI
uniref:aquaporin n=1 Tax=Clostridium botulinum TaxID=1491 RepID=UPI000A611D24